MGKVRPELHLVGVVAVPDQAVGEEAPGMLQAQALIHTWQENVLHIEWFWNNCMNSNGLLY